MLEPEPITTELDHMARPLLELMQRVSGLQTTFITRIDWADQRQEVLLALNTSPGLEIAERSSVDWSDSMCRWVFLSGKDQSMDVQGDFPTSLGATRLGIQTFLAVPIVAADDEVLGTVCGASCESAPVDEKTIGLIGLVSQALAHQMQTEVSLRAERIRAHDATVESAAAVAQASTMTRTAQAFERLAMSDALTLLPNRRAFEARFEQELARSARHGYPIALLRIDVDHFKEVNDTWGHAAGDRALASIGEVLRRVSRAEDVCARHGGDEFILAIPYCDADNAAVVAGRVRAGVSAAAQTSSETWTVSVGISSSMFTPRRDLMEAADLALYRVKGSGGDSAHTWQGDVASGA